MFFIVMLMLKTLQNATLIYTDKEWWHLSFFVTDILSMYQLNYLVYCFSLFYLTEADRQRVSVSKQSDNQMTAG